MKHFLLEDIQKLLSNVSYQVVGNYENRFFTNAKPILEAESDTIVWINPTRKDKQELLEKTRADIIICDNSIHLSEVLRQNKLFIIVENPKLCFIRIVDALFSQKPLYGIHPTAYIHPEAHVHPETYIGPFTFIGKSEIDQDSVIYGHCYIYDNVTIRKHVIIHAGTVIGADGFGYTRNEKGEFEKFPHIGGVLIEEDVEIGANTCIDRGTLGNTIIRKGAKIDNLVHIAHNVTIGQHATVIAHAMIGGSTIIEDFSWIAPSAALRDGLIIGAKSTVGLGAVVTKNVPAGETWTGSPAKPLSEFLEIQKKLKNLNR